MIRTKSARHAITIATAQGWDKSGDDLDVAVDSGSKGCNEGQILHGLDCGRVLSVVDSQRPEVTSWLYLAYGAPGWSSDRMAMACAVALCRLCNAPKSSRDRLERVAYIALDDMRRRVSGRSGFVPATYQQGAQIPRQNWRWWESKVEAMQSQIDRWDRAGLGAVSEMLHEWREARKEAS